MKVNIQKIRSLTTFIKGLEEQTKQLAEERDEELRGVLSVLEEDGSTGDTLLDFLLLHYRSRVFTEPGLEEYYRELDQLVRDNQLEMVLVSKKTELIHRDDWPEKRFHHEWIEVGVIKDNGLVLNHHPDTSLSEKKMVFIQLPTEQHVTWSYLENAKTVKGMITVAETFSLNRWDPFEDSREKLNSDPVHGQAEGPHYEMEIVFGSEQVRAWCDRHEHHEKLKEALLHL